MLGPMIAPYDVRNTKVGGLFEPKRETFPLVIGNLAEPSRSCQCWPPEGCFPEARTMA